MTCQCNVVNWRSPTWLPFAHAMVETAPERLLWSTDWPHSPRYNITGQCVTGELVVAIPRLIPDERLRRMILVENPLKLFPFDR